MQIISHYFTLFIYQPFFNILIFLYWLVGQVSGGVPDMGVAVIIFAVVVRLIMLPLTLHGDKSAAEKRAISLQIKQLKKIYFHDPVKLKQERRRIMRSNPGAIVSETITIAVQFIIILMLYRIFTTGLEGADLHLLYSFAPKVEQPINLMFLGRFDLSHTNLTLNIIQSLFIFTIEALSIILSPHLTTKRDFIYLCLILPAVSFLIFMGLPAGKKVFIITTLSFSILVMIIKQLVFWYHILTGKVEKIATNP